MTSSSSQVSLCNRALLSVGARAQIASLSEGSTESDACSVLYQPTFEQLARTAAWNCLKNQRLLTLLAAAQGTPENVDGDTLPIPPVPYLYSYAVPQDSLQIRFLLPPFTNSNATGEVPISPAMLGATSLVPGRGQIQYSVSYGVDSNNNPREIILTNQSQAIGVYTVNQSNPVIFDSLFEQAFVASLAAYLVPALSLNMALLDRQVRIAEAAIAQARTRDGNEGTISQNREAQWMYARVSGGSTAWLGNTLGNANVWSDMAWPQ